MRSLLRRHRRRDSLDCATVVTGFYGLSTADDDDEGKDKESVVSLSDVPDKVKATMLVELLREVRGLELEEIEREKENGKVYEAEFEYGDTEIELEIDANGKLLSKEVSHEEEEDDDDDRDDQDDDA